jgi:hypothetical protein
MATLCILDKWGYARASTRPRPCTHTPTHASTHKQTLTQARKKNTHTHKSVILIAFPGQPWFLERVSVLRDTYIACLGSLPSERVQFPILESYWCKCGVLSASRLEFLRSRSAVALEYSWLAKQILLGWNGNTVASSWSICHQSD